MRIVIRAAGRVAGPFLPIGEPVSDRDGHPILRRMRRPRVAAVHAPRLGRQPGRIRCLVSAEIAGRRHAGDRLAQGPDGDGGHK